ncbi:MAG: protein kinase [Deltaproteobacteria bacterium]|nr:protein kinase [Deltaproteobacteria bacterium]
MSASHELDLSTGACIAGRYRIERLLGAGGMGAVYVAVDLKRNERVAVKVLGLEPSSDISRLERFRREARAVTQIGHPNIVRALDAGMIDPRTGERMAGTISGGGRGFLVMELLEGDDLHARLRREFRLPPAVGVAIARQVAAGLTAAHAHGIVHRDLKPENVFLCRDGVVKVLDFGLAQMDNAAGVARVTAQNALLGTPEYMSPEQAAGNPVDARADVYALGCMLYEMFTGRPPFTGKSFVAVLMAQLAEAPVPPRACDPPARIPAPLEALILTALAKEADGRQPSMRALEAELAELDLDAAPAPATATAAAGGPLVLAQAEPEEGPTTIYDGHGAFAPPLARARSASGPHPAVVEPRRRGGSGSHPVVTPLPARRTTGSRPPVAAEPARRTTGSRRAVTGEPARRTTGSRPPEAAAGGVSPELALMMGQSDSDDAHTVPVPKSPRGPVTRQIAAQPDPLPRILDEIDPPERHRFDAAKPVVSFLRVGAVVAVFMWLLLR